MQIFKTALNSQSRVNIYSSQWFMVLNNHKASFVVSRRCHSELLLVNHEFFQPVFSLSVKLIRFQNFEKKMKTLKLTFGIGHGFPLGKLLAACMSGQICFSVLKNVHRLASFLRIKLLSFFLRTSRIIYKRTRNVNLDHDQLQTTYFLFVSRIFKKCKFTGN